MTTKNENTMETAIEAIYKEHNGLVLEEYLKTISLDMSFEFISNEKVKGYVFQNKMGDLVLLTDKGELESSTVNIEQEFFNISEKRIKETNAMLNVLYK